MFVLLSAATPSRLLTAFPPGVQVSRVTLDVAIRRVANRLSSSASFGHQAEPERADQASR
jgi:ATP-dependent DNA helicase DinG